MREPLRVVAVAAKPWWQSKTIWLNVVGFTVIVLGIVIDNATSLAIPPQVLAWLGVLLAVGNAWLRFVSYQPVATKPGQVVELVGRPVDPTRD